MKEKNVGFRMTEVEHKQFQKALDGRVASEVLRMMVKAYTNKQLHKSSSQ